MKNIKTMSLKTTRTLKSNPTKTPTTKQKYPDDIEEEMYLQGMRETLAKLERTRNLN